MSKRVIVAFPEIHQSEEWRDIQLLRLRWDPLANRVAPHLTLVFPFDDFASDDVLSQHLETALSGIPAFSALLQGITAHEKQYLFLNVKRGNDQVIQLHDALYTGILAPHLCRMHTFIPHITVGRVPESELHAALATVVGFTGPLSAVVKEIAVYQIEPDGSRPIIIRKTLAPH